MELPKNVTRVGQADSHCKIYVEDYVMTYLKQMNTLARDKEMAIALYGVRREEESVSYIFIYGAGRMNSLQREVRHLSQAQNQEAEKIRKHHFQDYRFLGYRILNGEMIDGMHICEQGICRYVEGYAQFYEKNDLMLAYMLASRRGDVEPEKVNHEKYDKERRKREEVRSQVIQSKSQTGTQFGQMKVAVVLGFAVLCMMGVATVKGSNEADALQTMGNKIMDKLSEDKILDDEKLQETMTNESQSSGVMVSQMTEILPTESAESVNTTTEAGTALQPKESVVAQENATAQVVETSQATELNQVTEPIQATEESKATESNQESEVASVQSSPTTYTIARGDNLIAISVKMYGDDSMVDAICEMNEIIDPDDIKVGQKILLP